MAEADRAFRAYIRQRDVKEPCICCGSWEGPWDAGHFLSVGSHPELRYEERNCHRQRSACNRGAAKSKRNDRTVSQRYREGLIQRIGLHSVEWLEGPHPAAHFTADELRHIRDTYRRLTREARKA